MVDTVQPHGLIQFRNGLASSLLNEDATAEMEQPRARHHTSVFYAQRGWMSRTKRAPPADGEECS